LHNDGTRAPNLIELLEDIEREHGYTGVQLSAQIGVDKSLWSRVRRGHERFGAGSCARIIRRYPELADAAAHYLAATTERPKLRILAKADRLVRDVERELRRRRVRAEIQLGDEEPERPQADGPPERADDEVGTSE
jgi:hypothetical protein